MKLTHFKSTLFFFLIGSFITLSALKTPYKEPSVNPYPDFGFSIPYLEDFEDNIYNLEQPMPESNILTGISPYLPREDIAPFFIPGLFPANSATVNGRRCLWLSDEEPLLLFCVNTNGKESELSFDLAAFCKESFGFNFNYQDSIKIFIECEDSESSLDYNTYCLMIHGSKEDDLPNIWNFSSERKLTKNFVSNQRDSYCVEQNKEPSKIVINHLPQGTLWINMSVKHKSNDNNVWAIDNIKVEEMKTSEYNAVFYNSGQIYEARKAIDVEEPITPISTGSYHFLGWTSDSSFKNTGTTGLSTMPNLVTFPQTIYKHTSYYAVWGKDSEMSVCDDLLITETANNKLQQRDGNAFALQIFNGTGVAKDLRQYALRIEWYNESNIYLREPFDNKYYSDRDANIVFKTDPVLYSQDIPLANLWAYSDKNFPNNSTFIISNALFGYASYLEKLALNTPNCEFVGINPNLYPYFAHAKSKRFVIVKKGTPSASDYDTRVDAFGTPTNNLIFYDLKKAIHSNNLHVGMISMRRKQSIQKSNPLFLFDGLSDWVEWSWVFNDKGTMHLEGFGRHAYYSYNHFYYNIPCDLEIFSDRVIKNGVTVVENGVKLPTSDTFSFTNKEYTTAENVVEQYNTIIIHPGGSLKVHVGETSNAFYLKANRLILKSDSELQPAFNSRAYSYINNGIAYHKVIANNTTHQLIALPFNCRYNDIVEVRQNSDYLQGWGMRYYDGESRSKRAPKEPYRNYWTWWPHRQTLPAYKGIDLVSAYESKEIEVVFQEYNIKGTFKKRGNDAMKVSVKKYEDTTVPNDRGWNLIGTPAFLKIKSLATANEFAITGHYEGASNNYIVDNKIYITVPSENYSDYLQKEISAIDYLNPYTAFFVQARGNGTLNYERNLSRKVPSKSFSSVVSNPESKVKLELIDAYGKKDETTVYVQSVYSEKYEVGEDLVKIKGKSTRPYLYTRVQNISLAFAAVADSSVNALPLVYQISQSGNFEIHMIENTAYDAIYLTDHVTGTIHDLAVSSYYFNETKVGENATRFTLAFVGKNNQPTVNTASSKEEMVIVPNAEGFALTLPEQATVGLMDAVGRTIYTQQYTAGKYTIEVAQKGIYFLVIQTASHKETYKLNR